MRGRARAYDGTVSDRRVTQRDPLGHIDGFNRYAYVANQSLTAVDSTGLEIVRNVDANKLIAIVTKTPLGCQLVKEVDQESGCKYKILVEITDLTVFRRGDEFVQPKRPRSVPDAIDLINRGYGLEAGDTPEPVPIGTNVFRIPVDVHQGTHLLWALFAPAQRDKHAPTGEAGTQWLGMWRLAQPTSPGSPDEALAITFAHELRHVLQILRDEPRDEGSAFHTGALYYLQRRP